MNMQKEKKAMMMDLKHYALENYDVVHGMDCVADHFGEFELMMVVNEAKGDFVKAIAILKKWVDTEYDDWEEVTPTSF